MRREDVLRGLINKAKKKLKNVDYIRSNNITNPLDLIYNLDVSILKYPRDVEITIHPLFDSHSNYCYGVFLEHTCYINNDYTVYREFFAIRLPKEFQDQEY